MNILSLFSKSTRAMSDFELTELRELHRIAALETFKLNCVKGNTAMVPGGQEWVKQQEAIVQLLENVKNERIGQILAGCGYPQGTPITVDLKTGKAKQVPK